MTLPALAPSTIPFNYASLPEKAVEYATQSLREGRLAGNGDFTKKCEDFFENQFGVTRALLTSSGTHALELAAMLLGIEAGDEVILPSFSFVSTANAFILRGAKPVFIDVRPDTLNLDETQLAKLITPRTKAIVPVHYGGVPCEMDTILKIAAKQGIAVIEDNAHGLFAKYKGTYLGSFGSMAIQSFHETKNFTCGEGGALLINHPRYQERAEILREKGTDRSKFIMHLVDRYTWQDIGSSYLLSDLLAAVLYSQLEIHEEIQEWRRSIWEYYALQLRDWALQAGVEIPKIPEHCESSYHIFYLVMPLREEQPALIEHLKQQGIASAFHFPPLHLSKMGQKFGGKKGDCLVTEDRSERVVRLPLHLGLTEKDLERIVSAVRQFPANSLS